MRCATYVLLLLATPAMALAQPVSEPLSRADVAVSAGWFSADRTVPGGCCSSWSSSLFKGVSGGFYWTDHLKTQIEIAAPAPTEGYGFESQRVSNGSYIYTSEEHAYRDTRFSIGQVYQFGRNATFHPFVLAGVDIDRERDDVSRSVSSAAGLLQEGRSTQASTRARPFAGVGFKAYFSERTFFTGEVKMDYRNRFDQMVWKGGIGIDFPSRRRVTTGRATPAASHERPRGEDPVELWRAYAAHLKVGALVDVAIAGGQQMMGELVEVDEAGIVVRPRTRVAEPLRHVPFDRLERLALHTGSTGADRVGAVAVGTGVGAGVFMTLLMVVLTHFGG